MRRNEVLSGERNGSERFSKLTSCLPRDCSHIAWTPRKLPNKRPSEPAVTAAFAPTRLRRVWRGRRGEARRGEARKGNEPICKDEDETGSRGIDYVGGPPRCATHQSALPSKRALLRSRHAAVEESEEASGEARVHECVDGLRGVLLHDALSAARFLRLGRGIRGEAAGRCGARSCGGRVLSGAGMSAGEVPEDPVALVALVAVLVPVGKMRVKCWKGQEGHDAHPRHAFPQGRKEHLLPLLLLRAGCDGNLPPGCSAPLLFASFRVCGSVRAALASFFPPKSDEIFRPISFSFLWRPPQSGFLRQPLEPPTLHRRPPSLFPLRPSPYCSRPLR